MKVTLYALSTCAWCRRIKRFFKENEIVYDFVDVDLLEGDEKEQRRSELKEWNPKGSYPTVVVDDDKVVTGFNRIYGACEFILAGSIPFHHSNALLFFR